MDEDVATTNLAEQDALCGVVEKSWKVPGDRPSTPEEKAQDVMLQTNPSTVKIATDQPTNQSNSVICQYIWILRKFAESGKKHFRWNRADVLRKPNDFFDLL